MKVTIKLTPFTTTIGLVAVFVVAVLLLKLSASGTVIGPNTPPPAVPTTGSPALSDLVGRPAPDFELPSYGNEPVRLSNLKGKKVVLFFNEGIMCYPACWDQIASLGKDERFGGDDAVALSVVVDPKERWKFAVDKLPDLARATVLFDADRSASQAYGVLSLPSSMHPGQLPGHTYIVIDREGIVRWVKDDPTMSNWNDELVKQLAALS